MKKNKNIIFLFLCILLFSITTAYANERYVFIKSKSLSQVDVLINGFKQSYSKAEVSVLDLEGKRNTGKVKTFIKEKKPSLIICLGSLAAKTTVRVEKNIPILFAMVINYKRQKELVQKNVTGVSMEIPAAVIFTQFKMIFPEIKKIGVPHSPVNSKEIVSDSIVATNKIKIKLIAIEVQNPSEIEEKLILNRKKYSGIWMLADTKLYNRKTTALQELIKYSLNQNLPLIVFSEAFLKRGALFSVSINYKSLGSQLALISRKIVLDKIKPSIIPVASPIGTYTVINKSVAKKIMGNKINDIIYANVDKIYAEDED